MERLKRLFSPGLIVAILALVFALGGTAVAERASSSKVAPNSISSRHIKDGSIRAKDINPNTLATLMQANRPTTPAETVPGAQGPKGDKGDPGEPGKDGRDGVSGYEVHNREKRWNAGTTEQTVEVQCPEGKVAIGGGTSADLEGAVDMVIRQNGPIYDAATGVATGWRVVGDAGSKRTNVKAWVICAAIDPAAGE